MTEATQENSEHVYQDYWGTEVKEKHYLPDGKQYFEFQIMNEGQKSKFQKMTNQDLVVGQDKTATVKMDPAKERHELIKASVVNWNLYKGNEPVAFSRQLLDKWLDSAPPKIVEDLEHGIRMANPWLHDDMTTEQINEEIDRLEKMLREKKERESGESDSANK